MKITASSPSTSWKVDGEKIQTVTDFIFLVSKTLQMVTATTKLKDTYFVEEKLCKPRQHIKKQRYQFANKGPYSQSYGFSSSHVWMWELDHKEGWALKNWCFWTMVLKKTLLCPLDCREIKPVKPKGNESRIFIERTDAEPEAPILWPPDVKSRLWKRCWFRESLRAGGETGNRRWDGWMVSPTQWTWVCANSRK